MAESVVVEFGRMDRLVEVIANANRGITEDLEKLDSSVSRLSDEWSGAASDAYRKAHQEWLQSLSELNRILAQVSSATATITQRHRDTESAVKDLWQ